MSNEADDLRAAGEAIRRDVASDPMVVFLAIMDELVDVACGTHPALKDFMRLKIYRSVLARVQRAKEALAREFHGGSQTTKEETP